MTLFCKLRMAFVLFLCVFSHLASSEGIVTSPLEELRNHDRKMLNILQDQSLSSRDQFNVPKLSFDYKEASLPLIFPSGNLMQEEGWNEIAGNRFSKNHDNRSRGSATDNSLVANDLSSVSPVELIFNEVSVADEREFEFNDFLDEDSALLKWQSFRQDVKSVIIKLDNFVEQFGVEGFSDADQRYNYERDRLNNELSRKNTTKSPQAVDTGAGAATRSLSLNTGHEPPALFVFFEKVKRLYNRYPLLLISAVLLVLVLLIAIRLIIARA